MKIFSIPCLFNGAKAPFKFCVGSPMDGMHPLHHQTKWLGSAKGGMVPPEVMTAIDKLYRIGKENKMDCEELVAYAVNVATQQSSGSDNEETNTENE